VAYFCFEGEENVSGNAEDATRIWPAICVFRFLSIFPFEASMKKTLEYSPKPLLRNSVEAHEKNLQCSKLKTSCNIGACLLLQNILPLELIKYIVLKLIQRNLKVLTSFAFGLNAWVYICFKSGK
jgi:hypothetical protein